MIRHSSSFIISLLLHLILITLLFYSYTTINIKPIKKEEMIKVSLSQYIVEKPIKKEKQTFKKQDIPIKKHPKKVEVKKVEPKKRTIKKRTIKKTLTKETLIKKIPLIKKEKIEKTTTKPIEKKINTIVNKDKKSTKVSKIKEKVVTQKIDTIKKEKKSNKQYIDENINKIIELLKENLYYPRSARRRGVVGKVIVKFKLREDSTVHSITIVSSQSKILSRAAIKTIENLSSYFPKPKSELSIQLPIIYSLKR